MPKPNECWWCSHYDRWLQLCTDDNYVNKHTGEYCCMYLGDAITLTEYQENLIDKNTCS